MVLVMRLEELSCAYAERLTGVNAIATRFPRASRAGLISVAPDGAHSSSPHFLSACYRSMRDFFVAREFSRSRGAYRGPRFPHPNMRKVGACWGPRFRPRLTEGGRMRAAAFQAARWSKHLAYSPRSTPSRARSRISWLEVREARICKKGFFAYI